MTATCPDCLRAHASPECPSADVVVVTFRFESEAAAGAFARAIPSHPSYLCLERKRIDEGETEPIPVVHAGESS